MTTEPVAANPPGLPAIAYRSGTQASVLRRMRASLATRIPTLAAAADDDPGVALLDAWATVADVVTFYQQRIANEGYLGTATERRSVLELARAIGYELRPGVSAATLLDLRTQATLAPAAGPLAAPSQVVVPKSTRVLSVPGPGELPQTFETDEEITLDAALDEILLVRTQEQTVGTETTSLRLAGVATGLRAGDAILVVEQPANKTEVPGNRDVRVLRTVDAQPTPGSGLEPTTTVTWDDKLTHDYKNPEVYAFGVQGALFGHNAPDFNALPDEVRGHYNPPANATEWPNFTVAAGSTTIDLDAAHPDVGPGSFLTLSTGGTPTVHRVKEATVTGRVAFALSTPITHVTLHTGAATELNPREVTVRTLTRPLTLALEPKGGTISGRTLDLERSAPLVVGRTVLVTGSHNGRSLMKQATITSVSPAGTSIVLDQDLPVMDRDSVRVLANVVGATHGETVPDEVLGSGDGSVPNQRFTLRKPNVTHVPAPQTPGGVADSLLIRVDGIEWKEVPSLFPAGPQDRVYVVRIDDDAVATVIFGDGEHGARLPTGQENVIARYRSGIGPSGEVDPHTLIILPQRPPGVASVDNPAAAGGASPPETLADARANAPLAVVTLDRVVALRDYQDFARAYGGIAKARASVVRGRTATFVVVTVTGTGGNDVPDQTLNALRDTLDARRDQAAAMLVLGYDTARFRVSVDVLVAPDRDRDVVKAAVTDALRAAFAVDRRDFGQAVTVAEVTAVVHGVAGLVACRVTDLRSLRVSLVKGGARVEDGLLARDARFAPTTDDQDRILPAELLLVDPAAVHVGDMAP
jgi:predicted phage baseplate assembly protein